MTYLQAMRDYYFGQRHVAIAGALAAAVYLLLAWSAYNPTAYPARSFAITVFLVAGLFMLPANLGYFFYLGPQTARVGATLAQGPLAFDTAERAHVDKMLKGFRRSYAINGALAALGLLIIALGFGSGRTRLVGTGLALALCGVTLLAGEIWSRQRALHYRQALLDARAYVQPALPGRQE